MKIIILGGMKQTPAASCIVSCPGFNCRIFQQAVMLLPWLSSPVLLGGGHETLRLGIQKSPDVLFPMSRPLKPSYKPA